MSFRSGSSPSGGSEPPSVVASAASPAARSTPSSVAGSSEPVVRPVTALPSSGSGARTRRARRARRPRPRSRAHSPLSLSAIRPSYPAARFRYVTISRVAELTRRRLIAAGGLGGVAAVLATHSGTATGQHAGHGAGEVHAGHEGSGHADFRDGRTVDHAANGFDPHELVRDFDWGRTTRTATGRVIREWELVALDREIEVAPGVRFAAWTYNGRVPGPTLRCREGERLRITFANASAHPHTIHFHGIHPAEMDGVPGIGAGQIEPRRQDGLRVRRAARRAAPLPLPRPAARRAHRQGPLRRVHRRPEGRPRGRRRARDGHERVRHELRPRERGLRRQLDPVRLHEHADRGRRAASSCASTSSTCSSTT